MTDRAQTAIDLYRAAEAKADAAVARGMRRGAARDIYMRYAATEMYNALIGAPADTTKGSPA